MSEISNMSSVNNEPLFPPRDPELPDIDEPWSALLITHSETEVSYASLEDPNVVYRVPLATQEEISQGPERNLHISQRFDRLLFHHCIHLIELRFQSEPPIDTIYELRLFLRFAGLGVKVERLVFDISEQAGSYILELIRFVAFPCSLIRDVRLKIRNGNFSDGGLALQLINALDALEEQWKKTTEVQVEVSHITKEGWEALERVSTVIAAITFDRLRHQDVLNHFNEFLQNSERDVKINIKSFELPGETTIYLPRGNVSLSIEAISGESKIVLECKEKLAFLSIAKEGAERLVGPELDINELRVTGKPTAAALRRITPQFANIRIVASDN
ncbi:hypothetical protein TRVA0_016S01090 [Trichomonascus vanleenenianus]|uniref:uncharacterized protein n=1 Tax=Trichomonascus vanleenenianus TaxID=2268995 RepID=UPI003EC99CF7